jgi:hypothetical protein
VTFDRDSNTLQCDLFVRGSSPPIEPQVRLVVDEVTWAFINVIDGPNKWDEHARVLHEATAPMAAQGDGRYRGEFSVPGPADVPEDVETPAVQIRWRVEIDTGVEGLELRRGTLRVRAPDVIDEFGDLVV